MIGKTLSHYRVLERLGGGAMGEVYLAEDVRLGRKVALKLLAPELSRNEEALQRFENEARAVAELSHPNLASIYDLGEAEGRRFLVLEYVEGETLDRRLKSGPLSLPEALELGRALARALAHAHKRGLVHRDIKAANVMVTPEGEYKLLDFGLARRATDSELTRPGTSVGTVNTMSPEQARGEPADERSDLWSVGVVLYQVLTGQMPFRGEALPAILNQILTAEPTLPSRLRVDLPRDLEALILLLLQKDPARRLASADELLQRLSAIEGFEVTLPLGSSVTAGGVGRGRGRPWLLVGTVAVLGCALVLALLLRGRDSEALTTTVQVEDEFGEVSERQVPTASFRKALTLFPFDLEEGEEPWLSYAAVNLLGGDLSQDPYLALWLPYAFMEDVRAEGYREPLGLPAAVQRKIARQSLDPWFVSGTLRRDGEGFEAITVLQETESGREVARREFRSPSLFALVDQMSLQLRRDLQLPEGVLDQSPDLPAAEISTESMDALRLATEGYQAWFVDNDHRRSAELLDEAVAIDPTFCSAQFARGVVHLMLQQLEPAKEALDAAMENLYRVPERTRFTIKSVYYFNIERDPDKAMAVAQMWATLHPEDVEAHQTLAAYSFLRGDRRAVIREYQRILEIDPGSLELLPQIGENHEALGELEEAEGWYRRFAEHYPTDPRSGRSLAGVYEKMGKLDEARAKLDETLLMAPQDLPAQMQLAGVERKQGRYEEARRRCEKVLEQAKSPAERASVYEELERIHQDTGRIQEALESSENFMRETARFRHPVEVAILQSLELELYVLGGQDERADSLRARLRESWAGPYRRVASIGDALVYLERGQPDSASVHLDAVQAHVEDLKAELIRPLLLRGRGRVAEMRGDPAAALAFFEQALTLAPNSASLRRLKAGALRQLGRLDEARATIDEALRLYPSDPLGHVERARILQADGDVKGAIEELDRALAIWAEADPGYPRLLDARALREEWSRAD